MEGEKSHERGSKRNPFEKFRNNKMIKLRSLKEKRTAELPTAPSSCFNAS